MNDERSFSHLNNMPPGENAGVTEGQAVKLGSQLAYERLGLVNGLLLSVLNLNPAMTLDVLRSTVAVVSEDLLTIVVKTTGYTYTISKLLGTVVTKPN